LTTNLHAAQNEILYTTALGSAHIWQRAHFQLRHATPPKYYTHHQVHTQMKMKGQQIAKLERERAEEAQGRTVAPREEKARVGQQQQQQFKAL
jgi:hypothetical protein